MAGINKKDFTEYIKRFDFTGLFNELGWDDSNKKGSLSIEQNDYKYEIAASLRGYFIITLGFGEPDVPKETIRKKISHRLSQTYPESLVIFHGEKTQYWGYRVQFEAGKEKYSETSFTIDQEADALFQRAAGLFFDIDEMDNVAFVDVKAKVRNAFSVNYDTVTKKFYDSFKKEHTSFKAAIRGIPSDIDLDWYTSVTLNRLMFCYFIQKKGFLDSDINYLRNKLAYFIAENEVNGFFSFYKDFLLVLFHSGLGGIERDERKKQLLGNIPYLNGGMFEVHELERRYDTIDISNEAFARIFDFFEQYKWHLDINPDAPGNEINPDVLGYIFEKYINQRADMGAYYTKEDITGYIGKNTIIPFLFDEVKRYYPKPFESGGEIWSLMKSSGDEYIYPAIKHGLPVKAVETLGDEGLFDDLPEEIQQGLDPEQTDLWIIRKPWNKPAPQSIALPTEIYREVIDRRNRYKELTSKIRSGEVKEINDLITYNLDIINFSLDIISDTQDAKLLEYFYRAVTNVTVLDPTCGSGAFLFAAMNILEPMYEILIERMRAFVSDEERTNVENFSKGKNVYSDKFRFFKDILKDISGLKDPDDQESGNKHPNQKYFIFKSIILNNLYGVDIMKEAVEIAKLRLFLKLVAQVHPDPKDENLGIEPLPDMDFNIKCGNTLVGFATKNDLENVSSLLLDENLKIQIYDECEKISKVFEHFKQEQLSGGETTLLKLDLKDRISKLNENLNLLLYKAHYGGGVYENWKSSHQPFHWFAEFFEIIEKNGGFDVIIGNPPYVEYSVVRKVYKIVSQHFLTEKCGNIYANVMERSIHLSMCRSRLGLILPLSAFCTARMTVMNNLMKKSCPTSYISYYGFRPAKLFEGANRTIGICIYDRLVDFHQNHYATGYQKWSSDYRASLFQTIQYQKVSHFFVPDQYPKIGYEKEQSILTKLFNNNCFIGDKISKFSKENCIYYRNVGGLYWKIITDFAPEFYEDGVKSNSSRESHLYFDTENNMKIALALFNSSLYWFYYNMTSDCWSLNPIDLSRFPIDIDQLNEADIIKIKTLADQLMDDLLKNVVWAQRIHKNKNHTKYQQFTPRLSKEIIDKIDIYFSKHFGFDEQEIDIIINYDVKYRMGDQSEEDA